MTPNNEEKPNTSSPFLWGITILLILLILGGGYWLFLKPTETPKPQQAAPVQQEIVASSLQDSIETEAQTSPDTAISTPVKPIVPVQASKNERVPSMADTLEYRITGTKTTYTLQSGETIIRASLKFFGTKKFWPYIAKHNQDAFKDADNIPAGAQIKIPELAPKD